MKNTQEKSTNTLIEGGASEITNQNSGEIMNTETSSTNQNTAEILAANKTSMGCIIQKPIAEITVKEDNRRTPDKTTIKNLKASMGLIGQLHPIIINTKGELVTGLHRYCAKKENGDTNISAIVVDDNLTICEIIKVEENTCRLELSGFQLGEYILDGYMAHKALNPKSYTAINQYTERAEGVLLEKSHAQKMIEKLGISKSQYYERLGIAQRLAPETKIVLKKFDATKDSEFVKDLASLSQAKQIELLALNLEKDDLKEIVKEIAGPAKTPEETAKKAEIKAKKAGKVIQFKENKETTINAIKKYGIVLTCEIIEKKFVVNHGTTLLKTFSSADLADTFLDGCLQALELYSSLSKESNVG